MKKQKDTAYFLWILLAETVGVLSGWITRSSIVRHPAPAIVPPLSLPAPVFSLLWPLFLALMGIGAARVWLAPSGVSRSHGLAFFLLQLGLTLSWCLLFFGFQAFGLAFLWLLLLWSDLLGMIFSFHGADRAAALLQIPCFLWVTFAGYLNLMTWVLNW